MVYNLKIINDKLASLKKNNVFIIKEHSETLAYLRYNNNDINIPLIILEQYSILGIFNYIHNYNLPVSLYKTFKTNNFIKEEDNIYNKKVKIKNILKNKGVL